MSAFRKLGERQNGLKNCIQCNRVGLEQSATNEIKDALEKICIYKGDNQDTDNQAEYLRRNNLKNTHTYLPTKPTRWVRLYLVGSKGKLLSC